MSQFVEGPGSHERAEVLAKVVTIDEIDIAAALGIDPNETRGAVLVMPDLGVDVAERERIIRHDRGALEADLYQTGRSRRGLSQPARNRLGLMGINMTHFVSETHGFQIGG